ncbi:hypothetical protein P154DRAFT_575736 [Amniculicola lignicola CBS 123094]|uniref:Zn(2)-C6 fungal-type domain-containing protein n=1 Tax=Amniculicola lignicola CBS 123094 TaxID=1392246 RepID=A0A6A5WFK2_9PLEO|nr:hypothetical protein P154DRAFT_575736 [Amniculicola lignicola CBS 123094]
MSFASSLPPLDGGVPAKVQIPRLERPGNAPSRSGGNRHRVQRACLSCRARKVKCNGRQPKCQNCAENAEPCVYISTRKDRLKTATEQNQDMLLLLRDLRISASDTNKSRIDDMLLGVTDDVADAATTLSKSPDKEKKSEPDDSRGEANVSAEVGSNDETDLVDEDLLTSERSRATGFYGKNSEVQWLRQLHQEADRNSPQSSYDHSEGPYGPGGTTDEASAKRLAATKQRRAKHSKPRVQTSSCSFYLDDERVEMDFMVDPFEMPPFPFAKKLLDCYLQTVQDAFPILPIQSFTTHFYHYYESAQHGQTYSLPQNQQALLNIVFAIGAVFSRLTEQPWHSDARDHLIFHSRAWTLSLKDPWWFSHPDLPQVQVTGLLALYYLVIGHVNRSWVVIGMSLRFGYSLGLHVRNEDRTATQVKKEVLSRMWWGLYSLESILSNITGRPSVGIASHISVRLPIPLATEDLDEASLASMDVTLGRTILVENPSSGTSSATPSKSDLSGFTESFNVHANSGAFLRETVKIGKITQKALVSLYSATMVTNTWEKVQEHIMDTLSEVEDWANSLPPDYTFLGAHGINEDYIRERTILAMYYYSAKMMATRPCLCRLDRRIGNQTKSSDDFNRNMAVTCVTAAKSVADLLPDDARHHRAAIYRNGPWWSIVHNIMQALTILMLEIAFEPASFPQDKQLMLPSLKKLVHWLREMGNNYTLAKRAYQIGFDLLKKTVANVDIDISDLIMADDRNRALAPTAPAGAVALRSIPTGAASSYGTSFGQPNMGFSGGESDPFQYAMTDRMAYPQREVEETFQDVFQSPFPPASGYPNLFFTNFDQGNPLPVNPVNEDAYMETYDQDTPWSNESRDA